MKKLLLRLSLILFVSTSYAATELPNSYTLTNADYELVGNERYPNFDIRSNGTESDPYVILQKLNQILDFHFTSSEEDAIKVTFEVYDGSVYLVDWDLYVENSKFRTSDYFLSASYKNLGNENTLDISTWNIEHFPKHDSTRSKVKQFIISSKLDIFGLQEIGNNNNEFNELLTDLGDSYDGFINYPENSYDINLAFIYKKDEITLVTPGRNILELIDSDPFPRTPIEIVFRHKSGIEFIVINNHLKCCDGSEDRRRSASEKLKKYIDDNYTSSNKKVVVVGDWNDRIDSGESNLVFENFMTDSDNYIFVDEKVSEESKDGPGWPNIDHILINKYLFISNTTDAGKLKVENFDYHYDAYVSDHFPVWVNLNPELLSNEISYIYKSGLEVFPNPCSEQFITLKLKDGIKKAGILVVNIHGQLLISEDIDTNKIDVSELSAGIYILKLRQDGIVYTGKFIKN
ncbi:MAG: T9SS type A sorting domain-containing protein [Bacteroidota bacterium]